MSDRRILGEPLAAWVALAAGVIAVCGHSATAYTIPVMMKSIITDLGLSRGEFAGAHATRTLGIGISGVLWGVLTDRLGARAVLVAGAVCCALGLVAFAMMESLLDVYLTGALIGIGVGGLGPIAASALVARRFGPRRSIALGALHAGDNLLTSFLPATTAALAAALGWRQATGLFALAYLVVAAIVFLCLPGGPDTALTERRGRASLHGLPWGDLGFLLLALSFVVGYAYIGAVIYHFIAYQTDLGLPEGWATRAMGNVVLAGFVGALAAGWVAGRVSPSRVLVLTHALLAVASLALPLGLPEAVRWLFPWLHGIAMGAYAPLLPLVVADRYGAGAPNLGTILGMVSVLALAGAWLGNLTGGLVHDAAGTYLPAWQGFSTVLVLSLAIPWWLAMLPKARA